MSVTPERQRLSRLLIAEDDARQRQTVTDVLVEEGFHVASCATGGEALNRLRHEDFGVAIVDLRLPDIGESELLDKLRDLAPKAHIILHTGYGSLASAKSAVNIGAFAYVEKGGDPGELVAHVHRAFRTHIDRYADNLEAAVAERTAELTAANRALQSEIADRKRAEEALKEANERFQLVFEIANIASCLVDLDGRFMRVNEQMCGMYGYTREELESMTIKDITHPKDLRVSPRFMERASSGECDHGRFVKRYIHKDGHIVWGESFSSIVRDAQGNPLYFISYVLDITEREEAGEALRESEERLDLAVKGANLGMWDWNVKTGDVAYSERWAEMLGYELDELAPDISTWETLMHPEDKDRVMDALHQHFEDDELGYNPEFRLKTKSGGWRWINCLGKAVVRDEEQKPLRMVGIHIDITERKAAEAELMRMHRELLQTSRRAGIAEAASNVLHNVGNVLNSVNVSATRMAEKAGRSRVSDLTEVAELIAAHSAGLGTFMHEDEKGRHLPGFLTKLAEHLNAEQATIVEELQGLTENIEHIKIIVSMQHSYTGVFGLVESLCLSELLDDVLTISAASHSRNEIAVVREYSETPPVETDKHKLLQVLVNLVRNATHALVEDHGEDKKLTIRTTTTGEDRVRIEVMDNGVGIPEEDLTRIFAHGFTTKKGGHGFGLHSSSLGAAEMGGWLTVHSEGLGTGATFTLELPLKSAEVRR